MSAAAPELSREREAELIKEICDALYVTRNRGDLALWAIGQGKPYTAEIHARVAAHYAILWQRAWVELTNGREGTTKHRDCRACWNRS